MAGWHLDEASRRASTSTGEGRLRLCDPLFGFIRCWPPSTNTSLPFMSISTSKPRFFRRMLKFSLLLAAGIVVAELLLTGLCAMSATVNAYMSPPAPPDDQGARVNCRVMVTAPNPRFPGHDFRGFRNVGHQERFDVVALGDSQTYAMGSMMWEAWPQQLEFMTDRSVYNKSFGGWTPVHFTYLMDDVFALEPKTVVYGLYATRSFGAYRSVYLRGLASRLREHNKDPLQSLVDRGLVEPVETTFDRICELDPRARAMADAGPDVLDPDYVREPRGPRFWPTEFDWRDRKLFRVRSAVERFLLHTWRPWYRSVYRETGEIPMPMPDTILGEPVGEPFPIHEVHEPLVDFFNKNVDIGRVTAVKKRLFGMDLRDVRVAEGFRVNMEALREIGQRCAERGIRFVVLWIPTKEATMYDWLQQTYVHELPRDMDHLYACERLLKREARDYLHGEGIEFIDALPALAACYWRDEMPYRFDRDGHPGPLGYRVLAEAVQDGLEGAGAEPWVALSDEELTVLADAAFPHMPADSAGDRLLVHAILRDRTVPPKVRDIEPYDEALVAHTYEVMDVRRGSMELGRIQVLHWAVRDGEIVPAPHRTGTLETLALEPIEMHASLSDVYTLDDTEEGFDLPLYFCVGR